jgi:hypothetical protein
MIVDCMTCPVRGQRCDDCAVTVLGAQGCFDRLTPSESAPFNEVQLDAAEQRAVSLFVGAGLVSAGAVARLRARAVSVKPWGTVQEAG